MQIFTNTQFNCCKVLLILIHNTKASEFNRRNLWSYNCVILLIWILKMYKDENFAIILAIWEQLSVWCLIPNCYLFIFKMFIFNLFYFTILYWFYHTLTWIHHGCTWVPNPEPPPTSHPISSLWIIPMHQPQAFWYF